MTTLKTIKGINIQEMKPEISLPLMWILRLRK